MSQAKERRLKAETERERQIESEWQAYCDETRRNGES